MHKRLKEAVIASCALFICLGGFMPGRASGAEKETVDTITLETEAASEEDVLVDLRWKTRKEGGKWIETLDISQDVNSLVLILNDEDTVQSPSVNAQEKTNSRVKKRDMPANSRLLYYSKGSDGEWKEIFVTTCVLSGGMMMDTEEIYGIYRAEDAFGINDNPGSLIPYQKVTDKEYWIYDTDSEDYGTIVTVGPKGPKTDLSVKLDGMKAYSNYGMVLRSEEDGAYPALIINCQQSDASEDTIGGIQVPQSYVRMLIQSIDSETRVVIASDVTALEDMS